MSQQDVRVTLLIVLSNYHRTLPIALCNLPKVISILNYSLEMPDSGESAVHGCLSVISWLSDPLG
jgi:hypothetical protein